MLTFSFSSAYMACGLPAMSQIYHTASGVPSMKSEESMVVVKVILYYIL